METRDTSLAMLQELLQVKLGNRPKLQSVYSIQHPSEDMAIYLESVVILVKTNQRQ